MKSKSIISFISITLFCHLAYASSCQDLAKSFASSTSSMSAEELAALRKCVDVAIDKQLDLPIKNINTAPAAADVTAFSAKKNLQLKKPLVDKPLVDKPSVEIASPASK